MCVTAYIGLGSNLGDRKTNIRRAIDALDRHRGVWVRGCSTMLETRPLGVTDQPGFLNAVLEVQTHLAPEVLMSAMQEVERALGRVRQRRWGPRTIDLDLLLFGTQKISLPGLTVPHPAIFERPFVLSGLMELGAPLKS